MYNWGRLTIWNVINVYRMLNANCQTQPIQYIYIYILEYTYVLFIYLSNKFSFIVYWQLVLIINIHHLLNWSILIEISQSIGFHIMLIFAYDVEKKSNETI